jgi:hypothetical protein
LPYKKISMQQASPTLNPKILISEKILQRQRFRSAVLK